MLFKIIIASFGIVGMITGVYYTINFEKQELEREPEPEPELA